MPAPDTLLKIIGHAVVDAVGGSVFDDYVIEVTPNLTKQVWKLWHQASPEEAQKRATLEALVWVFADEAESLAEAVVEELTLAAPEMKKALLSYLRLVPATVRNRCRRPAHPAGTTVPANLPLSAPLDIVDLLPARMPWFDVGERIGSLGDWELQEILEFPAFGEVWKAISPRQAHVPASAMHFFLAPDAREYIKREESRVLDQVLLQARNPGLVPLQKLFVDIDPPCVQYAHVEAANLPALVEEWRETGQKIDPATVADLIRQLAHTLGTLHQLQPPLVVRHLRPANILVQPAGGKFTCLLARVGLGPWTSTRHPREELSLYASPEQQAGAPPHPRDDVFALGVLWHQLLTGNLTTGRPGGSHWRRKLAEMGMTQSLIELLETCFEDDPNYRPANGAELAAKLQEVLATPPPEKKQAREEGESRGRSRRPDVWQLLDSLEQTEPAKPKLVTNSLDLKLVLIPAGKFQMGSPDNEPGRRVCEGPLHEVSITKPFYLGVVPITQRFFEQVMGRNPAHFKPDRGGDYDHPVESVTWEEAVQFCQALSSRPEEKGRRYRLPTEAEWEYACRGGTSTLFGFGPALGHGQANFDSAFPHAGPSGFPLEKTSKVGLFAANSFGLLDMHGNVWEWCSDWLDADYYRRSVKRDPQGPETGDFRVLRGGSWRNQALTCRCAYRNGLSPRLRDKYTGFRIAFDA